MFPLFVGRGREKEERRGRRRAGITEKKCNQFVLLEEGLIRLPPASSTRSCCSSNSSSTDAQQRQPWSTAVWVDWVDWVDGVPHFHTGPNLHRPGIKAQGFISSDAAIAVRRRPD